MLILVYNVAGQTVNTTKHLLCKKLKHTTHCKLFFTIKFTQCKHSTYLKYLCVLCVDVHQVGLNSIVCSYYTTKYAKLPKNCDVSFAIGHRSLVGCRLPRLCWYSWPPRICRLIPWVALSSGDFLCLGSWHQTNWWHDSPLPHGLL